MKKLMLALALAASVSACKSIDFTSVASNEITATGGEAIAVIQASTMGWTLFFHLVDIVKSDLDVTINKVLIAEAKDMGASKVDLKSASTTPRHGIFALAGQITSPTFSTAVGVAVK